MALEAAADAAPPPPPPPPLALERAASSTPALLEAASSSAGWSDGSDGSDREPERQAGGASGGDRRRGRRELRAARSAEAFRRLPSLGQGRRRRPLLAAAGAESDPCLLEAGDSLDSEGELSSEAREQEADAWEEQEQEPVAQRLRVVVVRAQPSPPSAQSSSSSSSTSSALERLSTADRESLALMRSQHRRTAAPLGMADGADRHGRPPLAPGERSARKKIDRSRSAVRAWLSATVTKRTLRKLSAVRNSYFACWLVVCSLAVVVLQVVAVTIVHFLYQPPVPGSASTSFDGSSSFESSYSSLHAFHMSAHTDPTHEACGGRLLLMMHLVGMPNVMLLAPVVFPSTAIFQLYVVRDRRMVRRPYLLLCELMVAAQLAFMTYFAVRQVLNVPRIVECHARARSHEVLMFYSSMVVWIVLLRQIIVFARFLTHIKLQADGADDSSHTSAMGSSLWKRLVPEFLISARKKRRREVAVFKKQLYRAAARGDVTRVAELLSKTHQQSDHDSEGGANSNLDISFRMTEKELLQEYKAPRLWFGAFARSRKNPLHIAVIRGHLPVVRMLLDHGFDPNALDKVSRVNFNLALIFKLCSRLLILTQDRRRSPLRALLCSVLLPPLHGAVAAGYVHIVRELIDRGADVNALPRASFYYRQAQLPPIFVTDDPQVLQLLVSNGANFLYVAAVGLSGTTPRKRRMLATPLQQSAFTLRSDLSEYLIECGADVALTPLHAAAARDDTKSIAKLLASRHATQVDARGERVATGVFRRTPLHWAAIAGSLKGAAMLLDHGADPNARDRDGRTPLHWAAHNNRPEIVSLLINRGADPQAVDTTVNELPVICFAAEAEGVSVNVFASLARAGASLHTQVSALGGDTALHIALQHENRQTALSLIKCGANMMTTNSVGKRAVDCTTSTELQFYLKKEAGSRKIMISYTHSHFQLAQRVREYLETREQLTCWLDTMDPSGIGGGAVWREEIARGISNCSLVLSLVSEGYTHSEWCLKELALAKLLRKPVLALIIEEGAKPMLPALESLIPKENQVSFYDFITGSRVQDNPRAIVFDIDELLFASRWQVMRPLLVSVMKDGRRIEQDDEEAIIYAGGHDSAPLKPGLAIHGGHGRRKMTVVQEVNESEDDERDDEIYRNGVNSRTERRRRRSSTGTMASVTLAARLVVTRQFRKKQKDEEVRERPRVLLYSPAGDHSVLLQKLQEDLGLLGFSCQRLDLSTNEDNDVIRQLLGVENVVFLVESHSNSDDDGDSTVNSDESLPVQPKQPTKCARKHVSEALSRVLLAAAAVNGDYNDMKSAKNPPAPLKVRVLPVVVQGNFLDLSKMYSLSRSQLYYFMDDGGGAQWRRSASELLGRLQREQDSHRLRIGQ